MDQNNRNNNIVKDIVSQITTAKTSTKKSDIVHEQFPHLFKQKLDSFNLSYYVPTMVGIKNGYKRYLLYNDKSYDPFSIWIIAWGNGNLTHPHNHSVKCTTMILSNQPLQEKIYISENGQIKLFKEVTREKFDIRKDNLESNYIHSLSYLEDNLSSIAHSLHIYSMPAYNSKEKKEYAKSIKEVYLI